MPKKKFSFGEKILQDLFLLGANEKFQADLKQLLEKFGLPPNYEDIDGKELLEFLQDPKSMDFFKETIELVYKYNLQKVFGILIAFFAESGHLGEFATGGKADLSAEEITNVLVESSGIKMTESSKDYYTLKVYRATTTKDHLKALPEIKNTLGEENERSKLSKNLVRDLEILRLKNSGLKAYEIKDEINKDPRFAKQKISYQDVPKIVKRLKTKAVKNVPDKDS